MKTFLKWWILISSIGVGLVFFVSYGGINYVNDSDFTKISFIIISLFFYCSVIVGYRTHKKNGKLTFQRFSVGLMTKLGMTGTVLGFIKMLSTCLSKINVQDPAAMQSVLSQMASGMSTALVTTAAGLICSVLLQLQIFNYDQGRH